MIKRDNCYLALLESLVLLTKPEIKTLSLSLRNVYDFLMSEPSVPSCPHCFGAFKNTWEHSRRCMHVSLSYRRFQALSLDNGSSYLCLFGCEEVHEKKLTGLYEHYY